MKQIGIWFRDKPSIGLNPWATVISWSLFYLFRFDKHLLTTVHCFFTADFNYDAVESDPAALEAKRGAGSWWNYRLCAGGCRGKRGSVWSRMARLSDSSETERPLKR